MATGAWYGAKYDAAQQQWAFDGYDEEPSAALVAGWDQVLPAAPVASAGSDFLLPFQEICFMDVVKEKDIAVEPAVVLQCLIR